GLAHASIYPYGNMSCSDGQIVIVIQNAHEWRRFCTGVLRRPDLIDERRFADNPSRVENRDALGEILASIFGKLTRAQARPILEENTRAWSSVATVADLSDHPALRRVALDAPGGTFRGLALPLRREIKGGHVLPLGEHTEKVRREFAEQADG